MLDLPIEYNQPAIVCECNADNSLQQLTNQYVLAEIDLSFYDSMGAGFCSGSGSSGGATVG